jgi:hypothetical protein
MYDSIQQQPHPTSDGNTSTAHGTVEEIIAEVRSVQNCEIEGWMQNQAFLDYDKIPDEIPS